MKFLALLFLAGIALGAAVPLFQQENAVEYPFEEFEDLLFQADDDVKTELGKKLQEHLDEILEKLKDAVEQGKGLKEDLLVKAKEIREKLKDLKIDLGDRAKELLEKIKDKAKDYWQKILERLRPDNKEVAFADENIDEIGKKLKERLDQILEKIKEALEQGKGLKEDYIVKAKEIREKLKDLKVDLGDRAKELLEKLKEKAKDYWQKILERLRPDNNEVSFADGGDDIKTELGKKLRERLDEILEKIKDAIDNGKTVGDNTLVKAKEIREKLRELKVDLGNKAKELLEKLKEKSKDFYKKLLENLGIGDKEKREEPHTEIGKKLLKEFDDILEKVKEAIDNGKVIKDEFVERLRDIQSQLLDYRLDLSNRAKELLKDIKTRARDYWNKLLERLKLDKRDVDVDEIGNKLKGKLDEVLEKIKDALEKGQGLREDLVVKAKELQDKLKDMKVDFGNRAKDLLEKIKEKARDYLQKILDRLRPQESVSFADNGDDIKTELGKKLRERLDEIMEKIKDAIDNGKTVKEDTLVKVKEIREKLRDLKVDLGNKAKELLEKLKEKSKDFYKKLLENLGIGDKEKREVQQVESIFEIFRKLRDTLKSKLDADKLKEKVESLFGKGSEFAEQIINALKEKGEKGKKKIIDYIDRVLGDNEKRSIKDAFERVKNYFKDLQIDLKEKFVKFGEWAKEQYEKGLEKGKTKLDNVKKIADEFIRDSKRVSKEVAEEALEFFREYKEDLGRVYDDIKDKVKDIVKKDE